MITRSKMTKYLFKIIAIAIFLQSLIITFFYHVYLLLSKDRNRSFVFLFNRFPVTNSSIYIQMIIIKVM